MIRIVNSRKYKEMEDKLVALESVMGMQAVLIKQLRAEKRNVQLSIEPKIVGVNLDLTEIISSALNSFVKAFVPKTIK